jgi:hypothetical protein
MLSCQCVPVTLYAWISSKPFTIDETMLGKSRRAKRRNSAIKEWVRNAKVKDYPNPNTYRWCLRMELVNITHN